MNSQLEQFYSDNRAHFVNVAVRRAVIALWPRLLLDWHSEGAVLCLTGHNGRNEIGRTFHREILNQWRRLWISG